MNIYNEMMGKKYMKFLQLRHRTYKKAFFISKLERYSLIHGNIIACDSSMKSLLILLLIEIVILL